MSTQQLISRFAEIGIAQDHALLGNEIRRFNLLFGKMKSIVDELRLRPGDERRALALLYEHVNVQVRLQAARFSRDVMPVPARKLIEEIAGSGQFPQAGDAGMTLSKMDGKLP